MISAVGQPDIAGGGPSTAYTRQPMAKSLRSAAPGSTSTPSIWTVGEPNMRSLSAAAMSSTSISSMMASGASSANCARTTSTAVGVLGQPV